MGKFLALVLACVVGAAVADDTVITNVKYKSGCAKAPSAAEGQIVLTKTDFIFKKDGNEIMRCPLTAIKEINGGVTAEAKQLLQFNIMGGEHKTGDLMVTLESAEERIECWHFRTTEVVEDATRYLSIVRVAVQRAQRLEAEAAGKK